MHKSELRQQLRAQRQAMTSADVAQKSALITAGVQTILDKLTYKSLHCYEPIASLKEVDVSMLEAEATYTTRNFEGQWQVVSFKTGAVVAHPQIDVIIVPMLGFDDKLHRIGYGGGYYDRLMAAHPQALRIGVCFEAGHIDRIPVEGHDMAVNIVVTEERVVISV